MGSKIIGLVGFIGSGKNSVADILTENLGFYRESFAGPVKDAVADIFGWDRPMLEGDTEASRVFRETPDEFWSKSMGKEFTPRLAMQIMGTEVGRQIFHQDLWVDSLEQRVNRKLSMDAVFRQESHIVISDVRFPNEIDRIKKMGGSVFRVVRGSEPEWYTTALTDNEFIKLSLDKEPNITLGMKKNYPNIHYSEWAWIGHEVDGMISNNGTLDELEINVKQLVLDL